MIQSISIKPCKQSFNSQAWIDIMNEEMKSMKGNNIEILSHCQKVQNLLVINKYLRPKGIRKAM